ncbi:MAG: hypothetical protein RIQ93_1626 [Verrucomicrobiota bacterium]|jgi:1,4-dihydroxy-2-naphthoyl-CoA hydrolase
MSFSYFRTVHLADTDAAGVVYFARTLSLCHEAYEEALAAAGLKLDQFLGGAGIVIPIAKSQAEYLRPLRGGERLRIDATPELLAEDVFAMRFEVFRLGSRAKLAARVRTEHICISTGKGGREPLPPALVGWLKNAGGRPDASSAGVQNGC